MPSFAVQDVCVNWLMNFCGSSALAGAVNATPIISKTHSGFGEIWTRAARPRLRPDRPAELIISSRTQPCEPTRQNWPLLTRTLSDFRLRLPTFGLVYECLMRLISLAGIDSGLSSCTGLLQRKR